MTQVLYLSGRAAVADVRYRGVIRTWNSRINRGIVNWLGPLLVISLCDPRQ